MADGTRQHQRLPVKAAIEGPAACFRLLDIDESLGMRHAEYVGLLYSSTDNRMTLEDIHEGWVRNADSIEEDRLRELDGATTDSSNRVRMLLPSFLRTFTALARKKYSSNAHEGEGPSSVNRLLLRDVFDNITNPTPATTRYGMCSHMINEDVCSFLLSQRPLTTFLFATYGEAPNFPRRQGGVEYDQARTPLPSPKASNEGTLVPDNGRLIWAGFLAIASDLQLIPRLTGIEALQAAVEQVSVTPRRAEKDVWLQDPLHSGSSSNRKAGMSYPQFVEVLALLAISASSRLRLLYPDIAGPVPSTTMETSRNSDGLADSSADTATSRAGRSPVEIESSGVGRDVGSGGNERTGSASGKLGHRKATNVRAAMRIKNGRQALASHGDSTASTADAEAAEARPSYDLGALKALFHHAQVAMEGKRHAAGRGRGRSRPDLSRPPVVPGSSGTLGGEALLCAPAEACTSEQSARSGECVSDGGDGETPPALGREGTEPVVGTESRLRRTLSPAESARLAGEIARRVSNVEAEILPHETSDGETTANGIGLDEEPNPESTAPGAGGAFARLVVIKELQPVPEHAPENVRHLLELTLDHHQSGRYALALETLERGVAMWGEVLGADQDDGEASNPACGLEASDEAVTLLIEASIYQSAGCDDVAMSTLLRADEAVDSIHQDDIFLRETLSATVLSEMGVALYYSSQTALGLRCFRLALVFRHKLLQVNDQHTHETEAGDVASKLNEGWKQAPSHGTRDSDTIAAEAGEAAAAITLNNFAVCLAGTGDSVAAAQALAISTAITTSALGVEHPRSTIVSRNLAIAKATKVRSGCRANNGRDGVGSGGQSVDRWEKEMWNSLGNRQWTSRHTDETEDLLFYNGVARSGSRVIPGGFFFAGKLPPTPEGSRPGGGNDRRKKKKKGTKKRGKSTRRG